MENKSSRKHEDFSKRMTDILNSGALNLALAIGYRIGLFDVMDGFDHPQTASNIARESGLNERYLAEWLGVMVSGGILELTSGMEGENLFYLPKARGDFLSRRSGRSNLGVYTQEIPLLTTCAMEPVLDGFHSGAGVGYESYPKFHRFMAQLADAKHRQGLVDTFLPSVEKGQWVNQLKSGIRVCDLGCGEGVALLLMAEAFPDSTFTGIDISDDALDKARSEVHRKGLDNVSFLNIDAATLHDHPELAKSFDYVTAFDTVHDQTHPLDALKGVFTILKSGGRFSMVDIDASSQLADNKDHPMGPFLYTISLMHCMPVGLVDGGAGLGMMWGRQRAVKMLLDAGFDHVDVLEIPEDPFNLHFYCKKTV